MLEVVVRPADLLPPELVFSVKTWLGFYSLRSIKSHQMVGKSVWVGFCILLPIVFFYWQYKITNRWKKRSSMEIKQNGNGMVRFMLLVQGWTFKRALYGQIYSSLVFARVTSNLVVATSQFIEQTFSYKCTSLARLLKAFCTAIFFGILQERSQQKPIWCWEIPKSFRKSLSKWPYALNCSITAKSLHSRAKQKGWGCY